MLSVAGVGVGLFDSGDCQGKEIAYVIIVLALIIGALSFLANKKHLASIGTFIFAGLLSAHSINWFNDTGSLGASFGIGMIIYLLGSVLGLISSIMGFMKK